MDGSRFDALAMGLAESGSSRRSILQRAIGGSFAAALAAIGIAGFDPDDAEAKKKSCKKKCKKKKTPARRRNCKRRCNAKRCTGDGQCSGGQRCLNGVCATPPSVPVACNPGSCPGSLICAANICVVGCEDIFDCELGLICSDNICVLGNECDENADCDLLEVCLLGLCLDI